MTMMAGRLQEQKAGLMLIAFLTSGNHKHMNSVREALHFDLFSQLRWCWHSLHI